jgi:hypothetical protein
MNGRDVTSGQDVQALARNPEKVAKVLTRARSHLARQGLDGIRWDERDINAGIVEEREKVSLWSLASLQPEAEPVALKGCGKVGDETVIGEPIPTRKDGERGLLACLYQGLVGCRLQDRRGALGSSDRDPPDSRHGTRNLVGAPL